MGCCVGKTDRKAATADPTTTETTRRGTRMGIVERVTRSVDDEGCVGETGVTARPLSHFVGFEFFSLACNLSDVSSFARTHVLCDLAVSFLPFLWLVLLYYFYRNQLLVFHAHFSSQLLCPFSCIVRLFLHSILRFFRHYFTSVLLVSSFCRVSSSEYFCCVYLGSVNILSTAGSLDIMTMTRNSLKRKNKPISGVTILHPMRPTA